ncbi:MAG TPA: hypothetical protein PKI14_17120 [Fervidobacterium sp.]|nr:hypothetical protein [Fervidobacterium sp.]
MSNRLDELVPLYYEHNELVKKHKKIADKANKEIKEIMEEQGITEFATNGLVATVSVSERVDLMEDVLIEKIKELGIKGIIKTKEYVDMDALETALYNGLINPAMLAQAQTKKEVVTLRVRQEKKDD